MVRLIEDGGLDSVWVGDHLLYEQDGEWVGPWEAWTTMSAIAAVTDRIEIGPLVAATPFHSPTMLAKKAATLDEISGGRFTLGLGAGWNRTEFEAFGFPYDNRVSRFAEAFTIVRTLLADGEIDFHGRLLRRHPVQDPTDVPHTGRASADDRFGRTAHVGDLATIR